MRVQKINILHKIVLLLALLVSGGCAQQSVSMKSSDLSGKGTLSVLQSVAIDGTGDDTKVVISADKPVAYTFYTTADPPKAVFDLGQTDPGVVAPSITGDSANIKRINVSRHGLGNAVMTRVEVVLTKERELVAAIDESDKRKLLLTFVKQQNPANTPVQENTAEKPTPVTDNASAVVTAPQKQPVVVSQPAPQAEPVVPVVAESQVSVQRTINSISADKQSLLIGTDGKIVDFKSFALKNPDRLVVDIFNVKSGIPSRVVAVNSLGVGTARLGVYPDKVRVVFDAADDRLPEFSVEPAENGLKVVAVPASAAARTEVPGSPQLDSAPGVKKQVRSGQSSTLESLDFKLADGVSRILLEIGGECRPENPVKTAEGLSLTVKDCSLPKKLQRQIDTSAFASVVQKITPYQVKVKGRNDLKILVKLRKASAYEMKQDGGSLVLDITNPADLEAPAVSRELSAPQTAKVPVRQSPAVSAQSVEGTVVSGKNVYTGRRVTLEFSDADVRKIFQLIAEVSNLNFLVSDDVSGTISLKLVNVPWDQALDVILENKGLGMQRDGNIVQIRPKSKIVSLADEEQKERKAKESAMEMQTEIFDVNYAAVGEIAAQFDKVRSERGTITSDARTNRVIVKDIPPNITNMKFLLKNLDLPEKQVMIEARIVEANSTVTQELGVQWGIHTASPNTLGITNVDAGFGGVLTGTASSVANTTFGPGAAAGISFGKFIADGTLDLKLSALASGDMIKIISTPKVVTLNNKAAKISQGQSIPYSTVSAEGTKTEFVEAALTLEVTPHITADGSISMKIKATNNSAGTASAGSVPPINKKEATTELLVKNGETTVIGGIYVDNDTSSDSGVPFLKDIPLMGWLFKSAKKQKIKNELLIFITPKIVL